MCKSFHIFIEFTNVIQTRFKSNTIK
uniref:Uncharacterized protein n=1 Tax=Lepeophtheirus salmonis TaxID=72036 RepID=A0A0K2TPP1_LEPSM